MLVTRRDRSGDEAKGAHNRETLQTTGRTTRIVIVPGGFAPIDPSRPHRRANSDGHQNAFSEAWRNLSVRCGSSQNQSQNQTLGRDRAASRWSAPEPR
jgi:hypothetical protein